jgi:tetratricopeptide (TPR) repeat protein
MKKSILLPLVSMFIGTACGCAFTDYCHENSKKDNYDTAIQECSKQISGEVKGALMEYSYNNRGIAYSAKNQFDLAIDDFNKAIELSPKYAHAFNSRGTTYIKQNLFELAIADFNTAIDLKPNYEFAYNNSGYAYFLKGDLDKAIADINRAIELNHNYVQAYNNRGNIYSDTGRIDQAIADYNKAIELDPKFYSAYRNRGRAYTRLGKLDQAMTDFSKAIELNPTFAAAYDSRGYAYLRTAQYDKAITDFNKAIELNPKSHEVLIGRGLVFEAQHHYKQAIFEYKKAIELTPAYEYSYLHLVIATWLSKTVPVEAISKLNQHVSSRNTTKWIRTISKYYLSADAINEHDVLQEARKGKDDREVNERLCEAYYYLAIKRLTMGNRSGAEEFFTKSVDTAVYNFREYGASQSMLVQLREGKL